MAQFGSLIVNGVTRLLSKLNVTGDITATGTVTAPTFAGALTGNADSATKATQDSGGQQINTTYIKSASVANNTLTLTKGNGDTEDVTLPVDSALSSTSTNPIQNKEVHRVVMKSFIPYNPIHYSSGSWGLTLLQTGQSTSNVVGRTETGAWVVRSDLILDIYDISAASTANYELADLTGMCDYVKTKLGGSSWTIAQQIVPCPLCEPLSWNDDFRGYGNSVRVKENGHTQMGRTYTTDGAHGDWAMDCYHTGAYSFGFYFTVSP